MDLYIKVAIPQELKEEWVRDKHLSLACEEGRNAFLIKGETAKIEKALADENITKLLELVQNKTRFSSYHEYVEEIGFFKDLPEWVDFMLNTFMQEKGIDVSTQSYLNWVYRAMYEVLEDVNNFANQFTRKELIDWCSNHTCKKTDFFNCHPQIEKICEIFIDVCYGKINVAEEADISYKAFLESKEIKENQKIKKA